MSDTKHTPGPWIDWATLEWIHDPQRLLTRTEDARLIAAAPDLLAALSEAADYIKDLDGGDIHTETGWKSEELCAVWVKCRDAIAAAKALTP